MFDKTNSPAHQNIYLNIGLILVACMCIIGLFLLVQLVERDITSAVDNAPQKAQNE